MAIVQTPIEYITFNNDNEKFHLYYNGDGFEEFLSIQDLADLISLAQAEKVKKDNEIKKQYT